MADLRQFEFRRGQGCMKCNYTGYRGRIGVYELLVMNDEVKEAILEKRPAHVIRKICTDTTGLISMREDGVGKVIRGKTTFEEVLKQTPHTFEMRPLHQILAMTR
jgi:type IV pilus assembly protein PilB